MIVKRRLRRTATAGELKVCLVLYFAAAPLGLAKKYRTQALENAFSNI